MSNVECQRFFAFSKRVPKDVKRFCGICRQHGKLEETRGHICEFKDCECQKCELVRSRRLVMSQQIRLRRAQDKRFQRTTEPEEADVVPILTNTTAGIAAKMADDQQQAAADAGAAKLADAKNMCYFCQKCKNHGVLVWKKQHKRQCPFTNCTCDFCELIETRRRLDQHIKRRKSEPQRQSGENGTTATGEDGDKSEGEESTPRKKSTASLPAQIEAMTMAGTSALWRASPPDGLSIPIGIARIAEQQELQEQQQAPLDALAAQLSRIQQNSPQDQCRQSPASSCSYSVSGDGMVAGGSSSGTSSPPPTLAPMVSMDQQQQQLLSQLLLSTTVAAGIPPMAIGLTTAPASMAFAGVAPLSMVPLEQMLAAASPSTSPMLAAAQMQPAGNQLNDALLGQMLMSCLAAQQMPTMAPTEVKVPLGMAENGADPQRELLLQIIAQLLQDQQSEQQQRQAVHQQQQAMLEAMMGTAGANMPNSQQLVDLHQLATLQSVGFDPALLATSLLITQQQQQAGLLKDVSEGGEKNRASQSPSADGQEQQQASPPHQSAFTLLRPGFGLP